MTMQVPFKALSYINQSLSNNLDIDKLKYSECDNKIVLPTIIDFEWENILNYPPKNSSSDTLKELQFVSSLTNNRSAENIEMIQKIDEDPSVGIKAICQQRNIEFPQKLFDSYYENTKDLIYAIKCYFNRPRPYQLAKFYNLKVDVIESKTANTPAYPSGHTVYARLAALIVASTNELLASKLDLAVNDVAYARCLQGVHFPSDNKASILVADVIFHYLHNQLKA